MALPSLTRFLVEDFPDQKDWIGKLFSPLNSFLRGVYQLLNKGLTFEENIAAQIHTSAFNNNTAEFPIIFKYTLGTSPTGCIVVSASDTSTSPSSLGAVFPTWEYDSVNNQIRITALTGLVTEHSYKVTFLIF